MSLFTLLPFQGSVTLLLAYSILLAVTSAMPPHRARWCDMVDSDDEGQAAPPRRNLTFPFYLVLNVFLDGLFNPRISVRSTMEVLQARLQADGRASHGLSSRPCPTTSPRLHGDAPAKWCQSFCFAAVAGMASIAMLV